MRASTALVGMVAATCLVALTACGESASSQTTPTTVASPSPSASTPAKPRPNATATAPRAVVTVVETVTAPEPVATTEEPVVVPPDPPSPSASTYDDLGLNGDQQWALYYAEWDALSSEQQGALCGIYDRSWQEVADKAPASWEPGAFLALLMEKC